MAARLLVDCYIRLMNRPTGKRNNGFSSGNLLLILGLLSSLTATGFAQTDTWQSLAEMDQPRAFHATCVANDRIYVFGGQAGEDGLPRDDEGWGGGPAIDSVEEYDPESDSWRSRAAMPARRVGLTVSSVNDKCYVFGGVTQFSPVNGLRRVDEYDPVTDTWRRRADSPTSRVNGASASLDGRIYLAGGWTGGDAGSSSQLNSSLEIYDPESDSWSSGPDIPTPRAALAASAVNGSVYFMGGGDQSTLDTLQTGIVESYSPGSGNWTRKADLPTGRELMTAASAGGMIFTFGGGFDSNGLTAVEAHDPAADAWPQRADMPTGRFAMGSGTLNGRIYVVGGSSRSEAVRTFLATNEVYSAVSLQSFGINPGLNDAWYSPATGGQGFLMTVFPSAQQMFVAWFTFDVERPPEDVMAILGDPGHRWLTAQENYSADTADLTIYITEGGVFDSAEPAASNDGIGDGTMTIEFADCKQGLVTYEIPSLGLEGEIPIRRIVEDNVPLCETLTDQ
jgi:N-acetylneuraminic acid mutarotase